MKQNNLMPGATTERLEFSAGAPTSGRLYWTGRAGLSSDRRESSRLADHFMFRFRLPAWLAVRRDFRPSVLSLLLLAFLAFSTFHAIAADESLSQKASQTVEETKKVANDSLDTLWQRVDEARLKNRSPDEIIAWALMGVLVGAVAAMLTSLKGAGRIGYLVSGLVGAFIGGIVVHLTRVDFGWGPVLIRYEELLFSFVGAILIVLILKFTGLKRFL